MRVLIRADELERARGIDGEGAAVGGVGVYEETRRAVPATALATYLCNAGIRSVFVDGEGAPLDVGRTKRLYTAKQRIALGLRDGGCLDCGAEVSRCEVHHIDEWWKHSGRTDLADGVLLCRNCHLRVHNTGARILRIDEEYWLHPGRAQQARGLPLRRLRSRAPTRFFALRT